ncbi:uncharacterized protein LOC143017069 [Genypterus blacodes]|uniref:uncharacterized protein LOC143017069 n=1 Tax=Genypterus blacodes TaxID=154954 RepID=UPI003F757E61
MAAAPMSIIPAPYPPFPPPPPPPSPKDFQAGELSHAEETLEFLNEERETQDQGIQPPPPFRRAIFRPPFPNVSPPRFGGALLLPFPYDYLFLTGQYPPGTLAHFSGSYEQGTDHWSDTRYEEDPSKMTPEPKPSDFAPQLDSEPVAEDTENTDAAQGGAEAEQFRTPEGSGVKAPAPRSFYRPRWFGPPTNHAGRYVGQVG